MTLMLITLAALAYLASGYAVNAGYFGLIKHINPAHPVGLHYADLIAITVNILLIGPLGFIVLALFWWEYGRQPFRWDWPWLLINEGDRYRS